MRIYVRKIDKQCIEKQISVIKYIVDEFFQGKEKFIAENINTHRTETVTILPATDTRFSAEIKHVVEDNLEIDDFLAFYENKDKYLVELIKPTNSKYESIKELCAINQRHSLIYLDDDDQEEIIDYSIEELGKILNKYYNEEDGKVKGIYLFGIKYGPIIKEKDYKLSEIIKYAGIHESYDKELGKAIRICDSVKLRERCVTYKIVDKSERVENGYNKIYYGAPGTGKSHTIDKDLKGVSYENKFRVTFHPEYTYNDFIGQLIPKIKKDSSDGDEITYEFNKGPFTLAIERAYENPSKMIYLIIEEMSRGNCAAIFGDIFQLLDREPNGESTYFINNEIITKDIPTISNNQLKIPSNLTILGTVNTSDQNVYVMDTAFKRRFEWKYIPINPIKDEKGNYMNNADIELRRGEEIKKYKWVDFYMALNKFIASNEFLGLGEDKQIGQFFIKFDFEDEKDKQKIENKLLHYLWFDIQESSFKSDERLFANDISSFGELFSNYEKNAQICSEKFFQLLNKEI